MSYPIESDSSESRVKTHFHHDHLFEGSNVFKSLKDRKYYEVQPL